MDWSDRQGHHPGSVLDYWDTLSNVLHPNSSNAGVLSGTDGSSGVCTVAMGHGSNLLWRIQHLLRVPALLPTRR